MQAKQSKTEVTSGTISGIVEELYSDYLILSLNAKRSVRLNFERSVKIIYVGYGDENEAIRINSGIRANVKNNQIMSMFVTPDVGLKKPDVTTEMTKMSSSNLFDYADLDSDGRVSYIEYSKRIKYSLKHGPVAYSKSDKNKSGYIENEFSLLLDRTKWWNLSRNSATEWLALSDQDGDSYLSQDELAFLLGSRAHIHIFYKRADQNNSGSLDISELTEFFK